MNKKIEIFKIIFNAIAEKEDIKSFLGTEGEKNLSSALAYACQYTDKVENALFPKEKNEDDKIWCNDVVILSIDNGPATRHFLSYNPQVVYYNIQTDSYTYPALLDGRKFENMDFISSHSDFGKSLIGRYVKDHFFYEDSEGKEYSIRILSHQRTCLSTKIDISEIEADNNIEDQFTK